MVGSWPWSPERGIRVRSGGGCETETRPPTLCGMQQPLPDSIDPKLVFRVYAWIAIIWGFFLDGGSTWLPQALARALQPAAMLPWGQYVVPRLTGAAVGAAGVCALGFARIEDPAGRRRALYRFAIAHLLFGWIFFSVTHAILGSVMPSVISWVPLLMGILLLYLALTAPATPFALFPRFPALEGGPYRYVVIDRPGRGANTALRSQYAEHIRQAARQEERARLARDLHDAVKQQLFVVQTAAATAEARFDHDPTGARAAIDGVRTAAREALTEMNAMIDHLQAAPIENFGLVQALRTQCEALGFRTGADVRLEIGGLPPSSALPPGAQQTLFRFAQEALSNVGRHARARTVTVSLGLKKNLLDLIVSDDGVGFDPGKPGDGMGRRNMMARAGELGGRFLLTSRSGEGTLVCCSVPYDVKTPSQYALKALQWAFISIVAVPLAVRGGGDHFDAWRAVAIGVAAIAAVAVVRYAAACRQVRRPVEAGVL